MRRGMYVKIFFVLIVSILSSPWSYTLGPSPVRCTKMKNVMSQRDTRNSLPSTESSVSQIEREIKKWKEWQSKAKSEKSKNKAPLSDSTRKSNHSSVAKIARSTPTMIAFTFIPSYKSSFDLGRTKTWAEAGNEVAKIARRMYPVIGGMRWIVERWPESFGPLAGLILLYINSVVALIVQAGMTGLEVPATMAWGMEEPIYKEINSALKYPSNATEQSAGLIAVSHNVQLSHLRIDSVENRAVRSKSVFSPQIIEHCTHYKHPSRRVKFNAH